MQKPESAPRLLPLWIAASLLPVAAGASEPVPLMTVVVEGTPEVVAPLGTEVENLPSLRPATSDTASLLREVPGVSLYGAGGVSSLPAIHGLADDRLRIKVDGMDLISACANHMNAPLSYIDPTHVERVTVFAGITPVSVGGDSIGGTILVDSPDPEFAGPGQALLRKGEAGVFYRSNGDAFGANLAATIASDTLSLGYSASTAQSDNYKAGADFKPAGPAAAGRGWLDGDEVGSSHYKSINQSLVFGLRQDQHLIELKLGLQDIPYQGYPNQRMDMTGNDSTQARLRYQGQYDWGTLEAQAYREHTRHSMQFGDDKLYWYGPTDGVPGPICGGPTCYAAGMPMDTEGDNSGLVVKADLPLSARDRLRVGGEAQRYRLDDWWDPSGRGMWPNTFWNIKHGERDRLALFGEWEAQWNRQWMTLLGLRGEQVKMDTGEVQAYSATFSPNDVAAFNAADRAKTDANLDLTALVRFSPDTTRSIELGYAQKTRSPNLYERYAWSTHGMAMRMVNWAGDGNGYVGNLDLEPEVAHTLSASFDWHDAARERWGLKATPYFSYVDNYIDAERCFEAVAYGNACTAANLTREDGFVYLRFVNQSARLYGLDVSGRYPLAERTAYGSFSVTGALSYVRGENRTTGDPLYNLMPLNAKLALVQQAGRWTHTAELHLVDAKTEVSQVRNEVKTAGYGLLNLRSSYAWKQARLDVGIENLFDRYYAHPLGGAYVGQGKTMSATDVPWGVPVPGMGRSIYTALTLKF